MSLSRDLAQEVSTFLCVGEAVELRKVSKVFSSYNWTRWIASFVDEHSLSDVQRLVILSHVQKSHAMNSKLLEAVGSVWGYRYFVRNMAKTQRQLVFEPLLEPWVTNLTGASLWLETAAVLRLETVLALCVELITVDELTGYVINSLYTLLETGEVSACQRLRDLLSTQQWEEISSDRGSVFRHALHHCCNTEILRRSLQWMSAVKLSGSVCQCQSCLGRYPVGNVKVLREVMGDNMRKCEQGCCNSTEIRWDWERCGECFWFFHPECLKDHMKDSHPDTKRPRLSQ